jgi:hypothetical protein
MERNAYSHVQAKLTLYKPNGTGRDTYISTNSGGFTCRNLVPTGNRYSTP